MSAAHIRAGCGVDSTSLIRFHIPHKCDSTTQATHPKASSPYDWIGSCHCDTHSTHKHTCHKTRSCSLVLEYHANLNALCEMYVCVYCMYCSDSSQINLKSYCELRAMWKKSPENCETANFPQIIIYKTFYFVIWLSAANNWILIEFAPEQELLIGATPNTPSEKTEWSRLKWRINEVK